MPRDAARRNIPPSTTPRMILAVRVPPCRAGFDGAGWRVTGSASLMRRSAQAANAAVSRTPSTAGSAISSGGCDPHRSSAPPAPPLRARYHARPTDRPGKSTTVMQSCPAAHDVDGSSSAVGRGRPARVMPIVSRRSPPEHGPGASDRSVVWVVAALGVDFAHATSIRLVDAYGIRDAPPRRGGPSRGRVRRVDSWVVNLTIQPSRTVA